MSRKVHNKLVRDKIPDIISAAGQHPTTRVLDDREYLTALIKKLEEELAEFVSDLSIEELADIQEVVYAITTAIGKTTDELEQARAAKAMKNGVFRNKIFLKEVSE